MVQAAVGLFAWLVLAALAFVPLFLRSERTILLVGHTARVSPMLGQHAVLTAGPLLPDVRIPVTAPVGVEVELGASAAGSLAAQLQRYAVVAAAPEGQINLVHATLMEMAVSAAVRAGALASLPLLAWVLLGERRRSELTPRALTPRGLAFGCLVGVVVVGLWQPWRPIGFSGQPQRWVSLADFLGGDVPLPGVLAEVEVSGGVDSRETARLIESAIDTYRSSHATYQTAAHRARVLTLHQPGPEETVAVLVSDRHDNIGMDQVHRALGEAAGATVVMTAGDDTSTGSQWEAFSLDSLSAAFDGFDKYGVTGNHDFGGFVTGYLTDEGWQMLDFEVIEGPGGGLILGADDPRSSGLGAWRDESGTSFSEVRSRLADVACASPRRVGTLLVHDAALGSDALARGCVDLVLAGHLHVRVGPTPVVGSNGEVGYRYTNGTSGGAAYAIALGKLRRDATTTLVTYRDGRPVGLQWVVMQTNGDFVAGAYLPLTYSVAPPTPFGPAGSTE